MPAPRVSRDFKQRLLPIVDSGNTPASSISTISADAGRQNFITGAAVFSLPQAYEIRPYLTVGAGALSISGSTPSITPVGSYGGPSALETDTVHITFMRSSNRVFTQLFGGGVKFYFSGHWGIRVDFRTYLYLNPVTTYLDASRTNTADTAWIINATDAHGESVGFLQKPSGLGLNAYSSLSGTVHFRIEDFLRLRDPASDSPYIRLAMAFLARKIEKVYWSSKREFSRTLEMPVPTWQESGRIAALRSRYQECPMIPPIFHWQSF